MVDDQKLFLIKNQPGKENSENGIPFVVTYHSKVKEPGKMIMKSLPLLYSDEEVQNAAYKNKVLNRFKLHPFERNVGCRGCRNSIFYVCKNMLMIHLIVLRLKNLKS